MNEKTQQLNFFLFCQRLLTKLVIALSLWAGACYSYATCTAPGSDLDFSPAKVYLREGNLSLADIYSADDLRTMAVMMATVTCEKSPVYVAIQGSPTSYFKVADTVFKYNSVSESYDIGALVNTVAVSIQGKGQAPGAKVFDVYVADEEMKPGEGWKGLHIISARAESVDTDWIPANCALDVPSIINLPDAAPGKEVSAGLQVKIKCDKQPHTYLSYQIAPQSSSYDLVNGVLYNENNIKISLNKEGVPADLSHLISPAFDADITVADNYQIISDIGKSAASGEYGTDIVVYLFHN